MSGGVHRLWKAALVDWLAPRPGMRLLDVAGGTGDIALRVLDRALDRRGPAPRSWSATSTAPMLAVGRDRALDAGWLERDRLAVRRCRGAAARRSQRRRLHHRLRHPQRHPDRAGARRGAPRAAAGRPVPVPGVLAACSCRRWRALYDAYSFNVVPLARRAGRRRRGAYRYLVESIRRFPDQADLRRHDRAGRARAVRYRNLSGGIAALHSAWRL